MWLIWYMIKSVARVVNRAALLRASRRLVCHVSKANQTIDWIGQNETQEKRLTNSSDGLDD